ncbi:hypothetical protein CEXT_396671 [Caerostris extrusa]|uniref:Uncharacterized protein n=1 Tax=Caerostris extrusa TaxID=172846 RepID=A0AAV4N5H1_CAEEX|nr:hypothetical protein CEXT_396671 [Caerostris extrusa]
MCGWWKENIESAFHSVNWLSGGFGSYCGDWRDISFYHFFPLIFSILFGVGGWEKRNIKPGSRVPEGLKNYFLSPPRFQSTRFRNETGDLVTFPGVKISQMRLCSSFPCSILRAKSHRV